MPSKSMRVDESKKMTKEKQTEYKKKRNRYVTPYYGSPLKKKEKEKEKEKGKTASIRCDPVRSTLAIWH